jgi:acetyltransferase-like isoleucine patch superfamily enzyme
MQGYTIGKDVYVGEGLLVSDSLTLGGATRVAIGDRVAIGQRVTIIVSSHPNKSTLRRLFGTHEAPVRIHDDAWVGAGALLLPGVTVGREAVVGAGAVVTESVPPRVVVAGNPARVIRRLSGDTAP